MEPQQVNDLWPDLLATKLHCGQGNTTSQPLPSWHGQGSHLCPELALRTEAKYHGAWLPLWTASFRPADSLAGVGVQAGLCVLGSEPVPQPGILPATAHRGLNHSLSQGNPTLATPQAVSSPQPLSRTGPLTYPRRGEDLSTCEPGMTEDAPITQGAEAHTKGLVGAPGMR